MLRDNRAEYLVNKTRGIPRDGAALLHGITWCGECGHKMTVRYKGGSQYVCNHLRQQHGAPVCQCLRSAAIDASVATAFLAAVAPAEIDAWTRARKAQRHADETLQRAEMQQIERLRYEARLAERQFNRVDPDNRLVAAELEWRWETALCALRRAEEALARRASQVETQSDRLDPRLRAKVVSLGQRLPCSRKTVACGSTVSARTECPPSPETASKTCARSSPTSVSPAADRPPRRQSNPPAVITACLRRAIPRRPWSCRRAPMRCRAKPHRSRRRSATGIYGASPSAVTWAGRGVRVQLARFGGG